MLQGTVKWFDGKKGFGFILADDGRTVFVHHSDVEKDGFRTLSKGDRVSFYVAIGHKGEHAANVTVIEK